MGNGRELLGDLRKDGGMLFEVIHHLVCGLDFQVSLLSTTNDVREAENKPAHKATHQRGPAVPVSMGEYKDPIHIVLQSLNLGFVVAPCLLPIKSPESIKTSIEVTYNARFLARIIGIGAKASHLGKGYYGYDTMALGSTYLDYGPLHVVCEFPRQIEPRCVLLVR